MLCVEDGPTVSWPAPCAATFAAAIAYVVAGIIRPGRDVTLAPAPFFVTRPCPRDGEHYMPPAPLLQTAAASTAVTKLTEKKLVGIKSNTTLIAPASFKPRREALGLSIDQLAQEAGLFAARLREIEMNPRKCKSEDVAKLTPALNRLEAARAASKNAE
jgi:hypothetical protein